METLQWFNFMYIKFAHTDMSFFVSFQGQASEQREPLSTLCASWPEASAGLVSGELAGYKWAKQTSVISGGCQTTQDHLLFPKHALSVLSLVSRWSSFWLSPTVPLLLFLPFGLKIKNGVNPTSQFIGYSHLQIMQGPFLVLWIYFPFNLWSPHSFSLSKTFVQMCLMCDSL